MTSTLSPLSNSGSNVIAVTNLKVTNNASALSFASVSPQLLGAAQENAEHAAQANAISSLIRQLLSTFVQQLFSSVSRLFGR